MDNTFNAKLRVKQQQLERKKLIKLVFYWHLAVFLLLNFLGTVSYLIYSLVVGEWLYPWLLWLLAGLSALLAVHYLAVFVLGEDARLKMIAKELYRQGILNQTGSYGAQYLKAYTQAERKMRAKVGLYWHLAISIILNLLCLISYLLTSWTIGSWYYPWFIWVIEGLAAIFVCHLLWVVLYWVSFGHGRMGKGLNT